VQNTGTGMDTFAHHAQTPTIPTHTPPSFGTPPYYLDRFDTNYIIFRNVKAFQITKQM
jgi:hypothetical protein